MVPVPRVAFRAFVVCFRVVLLVALICAVCALPAQAQASTVFGPKTYVQRTGRPTTATDTFSVAAPQNPYILRVTNSRTRSNERESDRERRDGRDDRDRDRDGFRDNDRDNDRDGDRYGNRRSDDREAVSKALITLNGVRVVGPEDFKNTVRVLNVQVRLRKFNRIKVEVQGNPGGTITVEVLGTVSSQLTITAVPYPAPNADGWNNSDVTVTFLCSDVGSNIVSCPPPQVVTTEGASQVISGTATDTAGNTATASISLNIDKTSPTISAEPSPSPNTAGWNNSNVTVSFTCSDTSSGVASCPSPVAVTAEGANQTITDKVIDKAGNEATATVVVNLDQTPPSISAAPSPTPNAEGWNNTDVTVTFTCTDSLSGVADCSLPATVSSDGAGQIIPGTATDIAGNTASESATINLEKAPPIISATISPSPNMAGWNNSDVIISFTCSDDLSGVVSCPAAVPITSEGALQDVSGTVQNKAGNSATAAVEVSLDKTPPAAVINSPVDGATLYSGLFVQVTGISDDNLSGISGVSCNGSVAQVSGSAFTCELALGTGSNSIMLLASDLAGNVATAASSVTVLPVPRVTITSPANLSYGNISPITVQGTVDDPNVTVTINGAEAAAGSGTFSLSVPLVEGSNTLTAVATNAGGNQGSASVIVTLDTTPPHVTIDSPLSGVSLTGATITVTGRVNDIVVGTVNDQDARVTVNGVLAQVSNRSYSAANVPLNLGANIIQAIAVDRAGNESTTVSNITRVEPSQPPVPAIGQAVITESLTIVSGDNQSATIGTQLTDPLVVVLRNPSGDPVPNQPVVFRVTNDSGTLSTAAGSGTFSSVVNTDDSGQAQVFWTLGQRSGAGTNTMQASSPLAVAPADFAATALSGAPSQIVIDSGDNQSGIVGQALTFPLVAVVTDAGHNRIPNVPVTFTVVAGGGSLNGQPSETITTDSNGRALAVLTLGVQGGISNNVVEAALPNNSGGTVAFTASGEVPGNPANTTISGVVLDNSNDPIPGATIHLYRTNLASANNLPQEIGEPVQTDAQGRFLIQNAPFGYFKLMADGSTATVPNKTFPTLEYDLVTVAGQDNTVGTPIYLPALDTVNELCVDETHGGTLTLPQTPGFALTVLPASATFPGGSRQGCISVSLVNGDKVPMPPGFGQQPRFIVTIQPVGTTFNPPAPITLPNVDGLEPRHVTEMYSYDHDLSMFVAIGTGTVSDDGSAIVSDPGVGVLKAGWHCGGDPNATGAAGHCKDCYVCTGMGCVPDPAAKDGIVRCEDAESDYLFLPTSGHALFPINIDASCKAVCDGNGHCINSAGTGFSVGGIRDAIETAVSKINDDSSSACIESGLRQHMQNQLAAAGLVIKCDANILTTDCANTSSVGGNVITVNLKAMLNANNGCWGQGLASTMFHEMVHGFGSDPGAPTLDFHNHAGSNGIDCRDRVYGCQESCFPGSTKGYSSRGNPGACLEDPDTLKSSAAGCILPAVTVDGEQTYRTDPDCTFDPETGIVVCPAR